MSEQPVNGGGGGDRDGDGAVILVSGMLNSCQRCYISVRDKGKGYSVLTWLLPLDHDRKIRSHRIWIVVRRAWMDRFAEHTEWYVHKRQQSPSKHLLL